MIVFRKKKAILATPPKCGSNFLQWIVHMNTTMDVGFVYLGQETSPISPGNQDSSYLFPVTYHTPFIDPQSIREKYKKYILVRNIIDRRISQFLFYYGYFERVDFERVSPGDFIELAKDFNDLRKARLERRTNYRMFFSSITEMMYPFVWDEWIDINYGLEFISKMIDKPVGQLKIPGKNESKRPSYFKQVLPDLIPLMEDYVYSYWGDDIAFGWDKLPSTYKRMVQEGGK